MNGMIILDVCDVIKTRIDTCQQLVLSSGKPSTPSTAM
jgi:hypothetical protein